MEIFTIVPFLKVIFGIILVQENYDRRAQLLTNDYTKGMKHSVIGKIAILIYY